MNQECEALSPDDREILADLLFPLFQNAQTKDKAVTRDQIRKVLAGIFSWPQAAGVLRELEEKDYVQTLSTRGGGIFAPGPGFGLWDEEMKPLPRPGDAAGPAGGEKTLVLTLAQAAALVALLGELADQAPAGEAKARVARALAAGPAGEVIKSLVEPAP